MGRQLYAKLKTNQLEKSFIKFYSLKMLPQPGCFRSITLDAP